MTWTGWLIAIPGACYLLASIVYAWQRNFPLSITYAGYFIGNVGLLMVDRLMAK